MIGSIDPPHPVYGSRSRETKDAGRRRYLCMALDFDMRAHTLSGIIEDHWEEAVKENHRQNRKLAEASFVREFGEIGIGEKISNFVAMDTKPFSIVAHHNQLFEQVRNSFVVGAYYPALVGVCALAERILNHLVIDLREHFSATPEFKTVYRKSSFPDWQAAIKVLSSWGVLYDGVATSFEKLMPIRHRSVHFNAETTRNLRDEALSAILLMRSIIDLQFCAFGSRPWFIRQTVGNVFITRDAEESPFIKTYYLPTCPFVGPYFSMKYGNPGWELCDHRDYGSEEISDEQFARLFNERTTELMAKFPEVMPLADS